MRLILDIKGDVDKKVVFDALDDFWMILQLHDMNCENEEVILDEGEEVN